MTTNNLANGGNNGNMGKVTTLPGKIKPGPVNAGNNSGNTGKVSRLPGRFNNNPARLTNRHMVNTAPRHFNSGMGRGRFSQSFAAGPSRGSFGGGGVRRRPFVRRRRLRAALTGELRPMRNRAEHTLCPVPFETG